MVLTGIILGATLTTVFITTMYFLRKRHDAPKHRVKAMYLVAGALILVLSVIQALFGQTLYQQPLFYFATFTILFGLTGRTP